MTERCQSGLMCTLGKRVYGNVSEVRILSSPPTKLKPYTLCGVFVLFVKLYRGFELGEKLLAIFPQGKQWSPTVYREAREKRILSSPPNRNSTLVRCYFFSDKIVRIEKLGSALQS